MSTTPFAEKVINILQEYCDDNYKGKVRAMQTSLGMDPDVPYMNRWLKCFKRGGVVPKIDSVGSYLDKIGAVLLSPKEAAVISELLEARRRVDYLEKQAKEMF